MSEISERKNYGRPDAKIETPQWMLAMFKAIGTLDMSATAGFSAFDDSIHMNFKRRKCARQKERYKG